MKNNGNRRKTGKEQFYTLPAVSDTCVAACLGKISNFNDLSFIEPAGGTGNFVESLIKAGVSSSSIISLDIEPKHPAVILGDFFEFTQSLFGYICISNPPFGRANSLSKKFFNHAADLDADYIAFLVPKSWRKWSVINSLNNKYFIFKDIDLPRESFETDSGEAYKNTGGLQCIFQIWKRYEGHHSRDKIIVPDHGLIDKVGPEDAHVALTIFGWSAGKVETEFERVPNTTKIFLKVKDNSVITALQSLDYAKFYNNVAYIPALSLQEINHLLNEYYNI